MEIVLDLLSDDIKLCATLYISFINIIISLCSLLLDLGLSNFMPVNSIFGNSHLVRKKQKLVLWLIWLANCHFRHITLISYRPHLLSASLNAALDIFMFHKLLLKSVTIEFKSLVTKKNINNTATFAKNQYIQLSLFDHDSITYVSTLHNT